jgi:hypothetical protein
MKLLLYRYFLNPTIQLSLFAEENINKQGLIINLLEQKHNFDFNGSTLGYVHERTENNIIYAKIGKRTHITRRLSPDENFQEQQEENWPYCRVFINVSTDPSYGQTIAFENISSVFTDPLNQLQSFADKLNEQLSKKDIVISIHPITTEQNFWAVIEENKDNIEEVTFCFSAPNLFNLQNNLNDDLRQAEEEFAMTDGVISLKNKKGNLIVPPTSPLINQSVEYITRGGGEYKIKAKGRYYTNKDNIKSKTIDFDIDMKTTDKDTFIEVLKNIFR